MNIPRDPCSIPSFIMLKVLDHEGQYHLSLNISECGPAFNADNDIDLSSYLFLFNKYGVYLILLIQKLVN